MHSSDQTLYQPCTLGRIYDLCTPNIIFYICYGPFQLVSLELYAYHFILCDVFLKPSLQLLATICCVRGISEHGVEGLLFQTRIVFMRAILCRRYVCGETTRYTCMYGSVSKVCVSVYLLGE